MTDQLFSVTHAAAIEKEIDDYFAGSTALAGESGESYQQLWAALYDFIKAGGKRFRPKMTLLAYELFDGTDVLSMVPIAAAQELLHLSLLIHDDIIDREYTRYGVPNIAGRYKTFYQEYATEHNLTHFANSAAILAGDLMLSGAHELIVKSAINDQQKIVALNLLSQSIFDVAGGELLDTEASILPYTPGDAIKIALYKTARYSFATPLLTGARLAGIATEQEKPLQEYAEALGIAYQLVDDLLGVFGSESQTGKSTMGDIREGKRTFMVEKAMELMDTDEKMVFSLTFGNQTATNEAITEAKHLLIKCGAKPATEQAIVTYQEKAEAAVAALRLTGDKQAKLQQLASLVTKRSV